MGQNLKWGHFPTDSTDGLNQNSELGCPYPAHPTEPTLNCPLTLPPCIKVIWLYIKVIWGSQGADIPLGPSDGGPCQHFDFRPLASRTGTE